MMCNDFTCPTVFNILYSCTDILTYPEHFKEVKYKTRLCGDWNPFSTEYLNYYFKY